jgi:hypothetical protein
MGRLELVLLLLFSVPRAGPGRAPPPKPGDIDIAEIIIGICTR